MRLTHFIRRELRARSGPAVTLAAGLLVAAVGFSLLSSESVTSVAAVHGTVKSNYRPAYDILVRPEGTESALERTAGLVRNSYLSDIYGGITMGQWQQVLHLKGVSVAAPIENVGYTLEAVDVTINLANNIGTGSHQLFRVTPTLVVHGGLARYPDVNEYLYDTTDQWSNSATLQSSNPNSYSVEVVPGVKKPEATCASYVYGTGTGDDNAFANQENEFLQCAGLHQSGKTRTSQVNPPGNYTLQVGFVLPVLISAIDPVQENKLVDLSATTVSGRALKESDTLSGLLPGGSGFKVHDLPLIAASQTYLDENLRVQVQRLKVPSTQQLLAQLVAGTPGPYLDGLSGPVVATDTFTAQQEYAPVLAYLLRQHFNSTGNYWTTGSVHYQVLGTRQVRPLTTSNSPQVWFSTGSSAMTGSGSSAPIGANDTQYRKLQIHSVSGNILGANAQEVGGYYAAPSMKVVGTFDPAKIPAFAPLSKVPLQTFFPPTVTGADPASTKALGDTPLGPDTNLAGYLEQPPLLLTTLAAAHAFHNPAAYSDSATSAPISAIQVRVNGVTGPNAESTAREELVAAEIAKTTGLQVDITDGSSPTPVQVDLPAQEFGRPALQVDEGWVQKGVSTVILRALDRKAIALFVLVLLVCGLFVANGALASVRARRAEIATLATLGWGHRHIFAAILGEIAMIGLVAGVAGVAIAAITVTLASLSFPVARIVLVMPASVLVAVTAGLVPAWRASSITPLEGLAPPVARRAARRRIRSLRGLARANLARFPGRTLLVASTLTVGIAALAFLLGIQDAFSGQVIGDVLGDAISFQVNGADYVSVALTLLLAVGAVADTLIINLRERAGELATLRATGWTDRQLALVVALEGLGIGVLKSLSGAAIGLIGVTVFAGHPLRVLPAVLAALIVGIAVCLLALLPALRVLTHQDPATALAAE